MESTSPKVVQLDDFRSTRATSAQGVQLDDGRSTRTAYHDAPRATVREVAASAPERGTDRADFASLYPLGGSQAGIAEAIATLREGLDKLNEAITLHRNHDAIGCDDCLQQVVALLPDLFVRSRLIGDDFGAVILATLHSIKNASGPLNEKQLFQLHSALGKIALAPYLDFDAALDIQEAYEAVGLEPDSKEVGKLGEIILTHGQGIC